MCIQNRAPRCFWLAHARGHRGQGMQTTAGATRVRTRSRGRTTKATRRPPWATALTRSRSTLAGPRRTSPPGARPWMPRPRPPGARASRWRTAETTPVSIATALSPRLLTAAVLTFQLSDAPRWMTVADRYEEPDRNDGVYGGHVPFDGGQRSRFPLDHGQPCDEQLRARRQPPALGRSASLAPELLELPRHARDDGLGAVPL